MTSRIFSSEVGASDDYQQHRPELDQTELDQVVGGNTALQHEAVHADLPNNGIQFGGGRTPVAMIAILIG